MEKEMSPLVHNGSNGPSELDMELDENDTDGTESTASKVSGVMSTWLAAQPKLTAKSKSGYILFSAEIRKRIMHENPDSGFGEVSKIVGIEWKKLSDDQKRQYEVRAEYIASERAKQEAARAATEKSLQPGQMRIYQCKWINCDSQFDSENGLYEHIVQHHTSQIIMDSEQQYVCMWEKHIGTSMKSVYANQIGRNFFKLTTQTTPNERPQLVLFTFRTEGVWPSCLKRLQLLRLLMLNAVMERMQQPHLNGDINYSATSAAITSTSYCSNPIASRSSSYAFMLTGAIPSSSVAVPTITDAGRTVVKSQGVEPVFGPDPHLRPAFMTRRPLFVESRERSVSKWDASLSTNPRNAQPNAARPPPTHWIRESRGRPVTREEDVVRALWRLRDELLESTCNMSVERDVGGVL
ncbi:HMG box [Cooperia oncophora]